MAQELRGSLIIGQSGGPTSVINASAYGVIKTALEADCITKVYGAHYGIKGVLNDDLFVMDEEDSEELEKLMYTPSSALGSCRYKMKDPDEDDTDYKRILEIFQKYDVRYFCYNGGNDSMDTCNKISKYMQKAGYDCRIMGVPKTIDNDLPITDHCPGYGSAAKYIATSLKEIIRDNSSFGVKKPTICIVEIMGRHAGWLTAAAALAKDEDCEGVDAIYLPEVDFNLDNFKNKVKELAKKKSSVVIAVSEGIKTGDGKFVCELNDDNKKVDAFGHKQLSGCASTLADIIAKETGLKTRAIEFSTLQRAATHLASLTDINEAEMVGMKAVEEANNGKTGMMITIERKSNKEYESTTNIYDIHNIANIEKKVPLEWIDTNNNQMNKEFIDYAKPLIQGELLPIFKNGLPRHLVRK